MDFPSTPPALLSRAGTRVTTLSLVAVILFVLGGLVVADRSLRREEATHAQYDAEQAAWLVRSFLREHAAALTAFQALYAGDAAGTRDREEFLALAAQASDRAASFRRVWLLDSAATVLQDVVHGAESSRLPVGLDMDTVQALGLPSLLEAVRGTGRDRVSGPGRLFIGEPGVVLLQPVRRGDRTVGFIGASVTTASLLRAARPPGTLGAAGITLRSRTGVVAQTAGTGQAGDARARAWVEVPGGILWSLEVHRGDDTAAFRLLMWGVGLGVLLVLTLAMMHERRQAQRIADRSSELERLSGELLAANRAKSEFLANISHELRTPLNAIVGFADLLRDGVYGELAPRQSGPVQRIEASATHLRQLVDQILDLAKIAAGRLEVHVETLDLRPFVLDVASEVESLLSEKALSLSITVGASLPRVRTDPTHLRQILVNLLGNAVKYTVEGSVAIRARLVRAGELLPLRTGGGMPPPVTTPPRPAGSWIALQVIDTGVGVPAADRERIFEEFEQVNARGRGDSARRGTGLGLPISRRLARLLGGEVTVDSEPGRGSTFTLWLPVE